MPAPILAPDVTVQALRELSPQADAATRTYAARFTIPDADDAVAYGMTAMTVDGQEHKVDVTVTSVEGPTVNFSMRVVE